MTGTGTPTLACLLAAVALLSSACGDTAPVSAPAAGGAAAGGAAPAAADALPAALFLAAKPEGAVPVGDLKKSAKEGETVVIRGRVGGSKSPFVAGRAVMTLADPKLVPCSEMSMEDSCALPWDYCCEDRGVLTAHTATVEVDGADGRPLRADLKGAGGIAELKTVTVVGTVGPRPDPAVLVVRATGIFVE
ncbi:MAG: hypothetical protein L6R43_10770 [Planctomycetes bacterium]|nr:hypothetical protein [Planctomycetota bacterium]